jgi:uncharacterized cupin superfamily protein
MDNSFSVVQFDTEEPTTSEKSGLPKVELTDLLGCEKLHARVWYLSPGDSIVYHKHREQEEVYVPLNGPGQLRIGGELVDVPANAAVRVSPETPRQPVNTSDDEHVWLIVGAPSVDDDGISIDD